MKYHKVYVCSPLRDDSELLQRINMRLAVEYEKQAAKQFSCRAVAPHGYLPYIIDDTIPEERELALEFGKRILDTCDALVIFGDRISEGMLSEIIYAANRNIPIYKYIGRGFRIVTDIKIALSRLRGDLL